MTESQDSRPTVWEDFYQHDMPVFCRAGYEADVENYYNERSWRETTFRELNDTFTQYDSYAQPEDGKRYMFDEMFANELTGYPEQRLHYVMYRCEADSKNDATQTEVRPLGYEWRNTSDEGALVAEPSAEHMAATGNSQGVRQVWVTNTSNLNIDLVCRRVACNYTAIPWESLGAGRVDPIYQANDIYWSSVRAYYSYANIGNGKIQDGNITDPRCGPCDQLQYGGLPLATPPTCRVTCNRCVGGDDSCNPSAGSCEKKLSGQPIELRCETIGDLQTLSSDGYG